MLMRAHGHAHQMKASKQQFDVLFDEQSAVGKPRKLGPFGVSCCGTSGHLRRTQGQRWEQWAKRCASLRVDVMCSELARMFSWAWWMLAWRAQTWDRWCRYLRSGANAFPFILRLNTSKSEGWGKRAKSWPFLWWNYPSNEEFFVFWDVFHWRTS